MPLKGGVVITWGMLPLVRILFLGVLSGHRALKAVGIYTLTPENGVLLRNKT